MDIQEKRRKTLNSCVLTGNLGADPEVFYNLEENPVTSFNIVFQSS